jgi:hypothetical protein
MPRTSGFIAEYIFAQRIDCRVKETRHLLTVPCDAIMFQAGAASLFGELYESLVL